MPQTGVRNRARRGGSRHQQERKKKKKSLLREMEILNQHTGEGAETGGLDRPITHAGRIDGRYAESKGALASALEQKHT